jgi:glyoxylase-like metal-dependent hydrolase (beta-lactamase superfamily II)
MTDDREDIPYKRDFEAKPDELLQLSPLVRRIVANNPGPFTFTGTCTYVVGQGRVAIIDPGPDEPEHVAKLLAALGSETIEAILITHTHRDHSPAARALKEATGAAIIGCGPHIRARDLAIGEGKGLDAANDLEHEPDRILHEDEVFEGQGFTLACVETPGHTMNHLAFALPQEKTLFSGDHVMAWSTTVVAPPDGAMQPYMKSLEKLLGRDDRVYWPGHGDAVEDPPRFVRGLLHHRRAREKAIIARLKAGDTAIEDIVANIYKALDPRLRGAAALSVFAHMEDLVARGEAICDGPVVLTAAYRPR